LRCRLPYELSHEFPAFEGEDQAEVDVLVNQPGAPCVVEEPPDVIGCLAAPAGVRAL